MSSIFYEKNLFEYNLKQGILYFGIVPEIV